MLLLLNPKLRALGLTALALLGSSSIGNAKTSEKRNVLRACAREFGSPVDRAHHLFDANEMFVLRARFNRQGRLTNFEVRPKFFFHEMHPEWKYLRGVPRLSWNDFNNLVTQLDSIMSKGRMTTLRKESPFFSSSARYFKEIYERAVLEWSVSRQWGDVQIRGEAENLVRYFTVHYVIAHRAPLSRRAT
jgi:hypothetical protein